MKLKRAYKKPIMITAISIIAILGLNSVQQVNNGIQNTVLDRNLVNSQAASSTPKDLHGQEIKDIAMNDKETFVIFTDIDGTQSVMHWGVNEGYERSQKLAIPVEEGDTITNVYADFGVAFAVVLKADGTNSVYGYGDNSHKQITQGTETNITTPTLVKEGIQLSDITIDRYTSSIYYEEGSDLKVLSQGDNRYSGLGIADKKATINETTVAGTTLVSADAGSAHTAVVLDGAADGVYTWGLNSNGQIGNGVLTHPEDGGILPVKVDGLDDAVEVYAGGNNTFAITPNGNTEKIWGWGSGTNYELGTQTVKSETTPLELTKLETVIENGKAGSSWDVVNMYSGQDWSVMFIERDGIVERYVWGNQKDGKLGNGVTDDASTDFTMSEELTPNGDLINKDQFIAFDGNSDTILKSLRVDDFSILEGFGANTNGALSPRGGATPVPKATKIYSQDQLLVTEVNNVKALDDNSFTFDVVMDTNVVDAASMNFVLKTSKDSKLMTDTKVTGIDRQGDKTVLSFYQKTNFVNNGGNTVGFKVSVDGGKTFLKEFNVKYQLSPSEAATVVASDATNVSYNSADINFEISTSNSSHNANSTVTKWEILDEKDNVVSFKDMNSTEGKISVTQSVDNLTAGTEFAGWKVKVYSTYGDSASPQQAVETANIPTFKTLDKKNVPALTANDFAAESWTTNKTEASLKYTIKDSAATKDTFGLDITNVKLLGNWTNNGLSGGAVNIDSQAPVLNSANGLWEGQINLTNLSPETTYNNLKVEVSYQNKDADSSLLNPRKIEYSLSDLITEDYNAPSEPKLTITEKDSNITSYSFDIDVTVPTADPAVSRQTKIKSVDYRTKSEGDSFTAWESAGDVTDPTKGFASTIEINNAVAETVNTVEVKVTYTDVDNIAKPTPVTESIEITTKPKNDNVVGPNVTVMESEETDTINVFNLKLVISGLEADEETKGINVDKAYIDVFEGSGIDHTGTPVQSVELTENKENEDWESNVTLSPSTTYTLWGRVEWSSGSNVGQTSWSDSSKELSNESKDPSIEPTINVDPSKELYLGSDGQWHYNGFNVDIQNDPQHHLTTVTSIEVTLDSKAIYTEKFDKQQTSFDVNAMFSKDATDFNTELHNLAIEVNWVYREEGSSNTNKTTIGKAEDVKLIKLEESSQDPEFRVEYSSVQSVSSTQALVSYKISKKYKNANDLVIDNSNTQILIAGKEDNTPFAPVTVVDGSTGIDPFEGSFIIDNLKPGTNYEFAFIVKYKEKYPNWAPNNNYLSDDKYELGVKEQGNNLPNIVLVETLKEDEIGLTQPKVVFDSYEDNTLNTKISLFNAPNVEALSKAKLRVKEETGVKGYEGKIVEKDISFTKVGSNNSRNSSASDMKQDEYIMSIKDIKKDTLYSQWELALDGENYYTINLTDEAGNIVYTPSALSNVREISGIWRILALIGLALSIVFGLTTALFSWLFVRAKRGGDE